LKAFFTSRATSIWVGLESRSADTAWWAISVPLRQQIPTWTGQGDPSVCVRGLEGHDSCVGGWKTVANLTAEPAAAHFETTRPNTEPTLISVQHITSCYILSISIGTGKALLRLERARLFFDRGVSSAAPIAACANGVASWQWGSRCVRGSA
jgi:hypothetical protein